MSPRLRREGSNRLTLFPCNFSHTRLLTRKDTLLFLSTPDQKGLMKISFSFSFLRDFFSRSLFEFKSMEEQEKKEPAVVEPVAQEAPSSSTAPSLKDLVAQIILSEEKYGRELNKVITVSYHFIIKAQIVHCIILQHFVDPFSGDQKLIGKVGRAEAETIFNRVTDLHKLHLKILEALQREDLSLIPSSIVALVLILLFLIKLTLSHVYQDSQLDLFSDVIKQDSASVNALRVAKNSRNFLAFLRVRFLKLSNYVINLDHQPLQDTHGDLTHLLRTSHSRITTYREFLQVTILAHTLSNLLFTSFFSPYIL